MGKQWVLVWLVMWCSAWQVLQAAALPDSAAIQAQKKARFVFNFDTRYTLFENERIRVSGLKTGIEWHNKFRTGVGYYFMRNPHITKFPVSAADQSATEARVKFYYGAVYGEYVLLKNAKWELSLPVQAGLGKLKNEHYSASGKLLRAQTDPLYLLEPSVAGHYKVWSWAGIGAGLGYRQMLGQAHLETNHLNAPIYYIKVKLFAGELYRQLQSKYCPPSPDI
ncbi:hypothetical protein I5M27_17840 [Adhaeribacter sp. BT258]|uniref:Outer membrane protein beta-barrel domain-containing protein n=1 Tax=Adhaeribacter terrigena TaxID=2793070 RepID=A0ABS1C6C4_9BACT|nr:hypothetical protein [Adhaeribacter terrigena]MBK0404858.1 hypothetical protein [Adhaeribacter terrigena]